jgi:WD40 repeat protein
MIQVYNTDTWELINTIDLSIIETTGYNLISISEFEFLANFKRDGTVLLHSKPLLTVNSSGTRYKKYEFINRSLKFTKYNVLDSFKHKIENLNIRFIQLDNQLTKKNIRYLNYNLNHVAVCYSNPYFFCACSDNAIRKWNLESYSEELKLDYKSEITYIVITHYDTNVITSSKDLIINIYDIDLRIEYLINSCKLTIDALMVSYLDKYLIGCCYTTGHTFIWNLHKGAEEDDFSCFNFCKIHATTYETEPDEDSSAEVNELDKYNLLINCEPFLVKKNPLNVCDPNVFRYKSLIIYYEPENQIIMKNLLGGRIIDTEIDIKFEVAQIACGYHDDLILARSKDFHLYILRAFRKGVEKVIKPYQKLLYVCPISHMNLKKYVNKFISTYSNSSFSIWTYDKQVYLDKEYYFSTPTKKIECIGISEDFKYLITSCKDKTIAIWNLNTKSKEIVFKRPESITKILRFSCDSKYVLSYSKDTQLRIWDIAKSRMEESYKLNFYVKSFKQTRSRKYIVTVGTGGVCRVWKIDLFRD